LNRNINICDGLTYVLLRVHFFQFSILRNDNVGNGKVRTTGMLGFKVLGTYVGQFYVITTLWNVT